MRPRARIVVGRLGADDVRATDEAQVRACGRLVADDALLHAQLARCRIDERAAHQAARKRDADVRDARPAELEIAQPRRDGLERQLGIRDGAHAREQRLGLIERERDVVLDVGRLRCKLAARHRVARIARRAAAEPQHRQARGDHQDRHEDHHAGRRRERAAEPLALRRAGETGVVLRFEHHEPCGGSIVYVAPRVLGSIVTRSV